MTAYKFKSVIILLLALLLMEQALAFGGTDGCGRDMTDPTMADMTDMPGMSHGDSATQSDCCDSPGMQQCAPALCLLAIPLNPVFSRSVLQQQPAFFYQSRYISALPATIDRPPIVFF